MAATIDYDFRPKNYIYPDRNWEIVFVGGSPVFEMETYRNLDAQVMFFHKCYSTSKAMVLKMVGKGSQYLFSLRDSDTRALLNSGQPFSSVASNQDITVNKDGSVDIYFGPTEPKVEKI